MQQPATPPPSTLQRTNDFLHNFRMLLAGVLGGPLLLLGGLAILVYGEHKGAHDTLLLDEGQRQVVAAAADRIDPALDGKLVHVSSVTTIAGPVQDEQFGINAGAVKLERIVEMLQWVEQSNIEKHGEPWIYRTQWTSELIDSTRFRKQAGHHNPNFFPFESAIHRNPQHEFGAYRLNASQIDRIPAEEPREVTDDELRDIAELIEIQGGILVRGELQLHAIDWVPTVVAEKLNPAYEPIPGPQEIGNIRVRFQLARPGELTVVAKQSGQSFLPFGTSTGEVDLVRAGSHDVKGMFHQARSDQWAIAWGLRIFSLFCVAAGCSCIAMAISAIAWMTGAADELPVFRFGCLGTIVLVTLVVVLIWRQVDFLFTAVTVVLAIFSLAGIAWSLRPARQPEEEIVSAEFADKGFQSKYSTAPKRE